MITRIRIEGEAHSSDRLSHEFTWLTHRIREAFEAVGVEIFPDHTLMEQCQGDPNVSVFGNWKGRSTIHMDTQKLNGQLDQAPTT
jgi:hypothetical protein